MTGGAEEDRTPDLLLAKQALSQLSYGPCIGPPVFRSAPMRVRPIQGRTGVPAQRGDRLSAWVGVAVPVSAATGALQAPYFVENHFIGRFGEYGWWV